jgi:hypothetical protein
VIKQAVLSPIHRVGQADGGWIADPLLRNPQDEFELAELAWKTMAPEHEYLPADATPIQCLLHARMTTSRFIYEMTRMRELEAEPTA